MSIRFVSIILLGIPINNFAQSKQYSDTLQSKVVDSITVNSYLYSTQKMALPEVQGTYIFAGKKTETVNLQYTDADKANKIGRQIFAKIPGVFVYDMDGAGNQINIATRGLDPHRGWEFNIRKDGVLTNSDMYGYPASHYNMPLESIDHIELVRGTGSLQYGAQFGGMLNYINKRGDTSKPFSFESITTAGSYHLLSTYLAAGGKVGKLSYYAYINKKLRDGYRKNEHTNAEAESVIVNYDANTNFSVRLEWARSTYTYRIPGALSDPLFAADPTLATRSRNYFNPDIHIPSLTINWQILPLTQIRLTTSAVLGKRNSVLFDKPTNVADTINQSTMQYNNRQVDIDVFNSYTTELRLLQQYGSVKMPHSFVAGIQYMHNDLHRRQMGKGTTGSDYTLALVEPNWGRDLHFKTKNLAFFAENKFSLLPNLLVTAGARVEMGQSKMSGIIHYYPANQIPLSIDHQFPLFGAGLSWQMTTRTQWYAGWSQSYRPMIFKDLIPASIYEKTDPTIKAASGYNAELGFRGNWQWIKWDLTGFLLREYNRFGTLAETDATGVFYTYRTNIGHSLSKGVELFVQGDWRVGKQSSLSVFTATAFLNANYTDAVVKKGNTNVNINGNKVESAPNLTTRNGITFRHAGASLSVLYSYTAKTFADALNTVLPSPGTGAVGVVPAYGIVDLTTTFQLSQQIELRANISNLTNRQYFTKRPLFYPGPGIWPADGRNVNLSIGIKR